MSTNAVGPRVASQLPILKGKQSGLLMHTAAGESVTLWPQMKMLTAFEELEMAIHEFAVSLVA